MNTRPTLLKPVGPASLADEPDFALGPLLVRPSLREIGVGEQRETLEPRVMQVLVALVRANGAVVSRDELVRQCWGGRIVGDDAINRCIVRLRQLETFGGSRAFEIETITRIGYRLIRQSKPEEVAASVPSTPAVQAAPMLASVDAAPVKNLPWRWIAAAAVVAIAIGAGLFLSRTLFAPHAAGMWTVAEAHQPFIATTAVEINPAISPNGSMIAYAAGPDMAHLSIYVRMRAGGEAKRLTTVDSTYEPAWSPDGSAIAYVSSAAGRHCRIMLIDALGGQPREVARCRSSWITALFRSGDSLFYQDAQRLDLPTAIMRLDLTSGAITQISHPTPGASTGDLYPSVSADGKTLVFIRQIHWGRAHVMLHDLDTGAERLMFDSRDEGVTAAWSTDSATLFVARNTSWDAAIWAFPVSGAAPQRITASPLPVGGLSSGPDGLLAMEIANSQGDLAEAPAMPDGHLVEYARDGYQITSWAFAPDGTLAVIARRSGDLGLFLAGPDKALHQLIKLKSDNAAGMNWSPDGTRLGFIEGGSSGLAIDVVDRAGTFKRFPFQATETGWVDWSEDGKSILVTHIDQHGWRYWRVDPDRPGKPVQLSPKGWSYIRAHDGMLLGNKDGVDGVWRLDGQTPRQLTEWPKASGYDIWTLFGDKVVYLDRSNPAQTVFMAKPIRGGVARAIGYPQGPVGGYIAVNPKTGLVAFGHPLRSDSDIGWMRLTRQ